MTIAHQTLNRFFFNHIFISVCAVSFTATGYLLLGGEGGIGFTRLSLVFFSTLFIYRYNTSTGEQLPANILDPSERQKISGQRKYYTILLAFIVFLHLLFLPVIEILLLGHLGLLSLLYNPPENGSHRRIPLRGIPFLKVFLITYIWAILGAVYPWLILEMKPPLHLVTGLFAGFFFFILGITLPFDIRDYTMDRHASLPTMAHLFGIRATRLISVVCILTSAVLLFSYYSQPWLYLWPMLVSIVLIHKANSENHPLYYLGLLDGTILLLYFVTYLSL